MRPARTGLLAGAACLALLAGCESGWQEAGPPQGPPAPGLDDLERVALERAGKAYADLGLAAMPRPDPERPMTDDLTCLARNAYFEAKGEGIRGMAAVIHVTLNRMEDEAWPASACEVVKQGGREPPCQFSWYCDLRPNQPYETNVYAIAHEIAWLAMQGLTADPTGGATLFHNPTVSPYWAQSATQTTTIGNHIFYRHD